MRGFDCDVNVMNKLKFGHDTGWQTHLLFSCCKRMLDAYLKVEGTVTASPSRASRAFRGSSAWRACRGCLVFCSCWWQLTSNVPMASPRRTCGRPTYSLWRRRDGTITFAVQYSKQSAFKNWWTKTHRQRHATHCCVTVFAGTVHLIRETEM